MCRKASCGTCKKSAWWGCGAHVPSVMDDVPDADRCTCEPKVEREGKLYPPMAPMSGWSSWNLFGGSATREPEKARAGPELK